MKPYMYRYTHTVKKNSHSNSPVAGDCPALLTGGGPFLSGLLARAAPPLPVLLAAPGLASSLPLAETAERERDRLVISSGMR